MDSQKSFNKGSKVEIVLGALLLIALTGCIVRDDRPHGEVVWATPPPVETTVAVQDDYVYYPRYNVYYNSSRRQYAYLESGAWVSMPRPQGVSVDVLFASPSVRMDFHDSPENHHEEMARRYPTNWKPAPHEGQNREEDKRDERK